MEALLNSSKLLKHWPSILLGLVLAVVIKYIMEYRRKHQLNPDKLDGEEDIAGNYLRSWCLQSSYQKIGLLYHTVSNN